jgi:hypothetical protein
MIRKLFFVVSFTLVLTAVVSPQTRTVTNADLEKYKQARVKAEKDLNENYAKMGFASPEERAKRNATSTQELIELSTRLRAEARAREQAEAELAWQRAEQARYEAVLRALAAQQLQQQPVNNYPYWYGNVYQTWGNPWWRPQQQIGGGWRATGGGLIYEPGGKSSWIWNPPVINPPVRPRPRP